MFCEHRDIDPPRSGGLVTAPADYCVNGLLGALRLVPPDNTPRSGIRTVGFYSQSLRVIGLPLSLSIAVWATGFLSPLSSANGVVVMSRQNQFKDA